MASRQELQALVARSPAAVAAHDRASWLELFSDDAYIEDPVGSQPVRKADGALARFYDTFIAPHQIQFEVLNDYYLGNDVFRDVIVHTQVRRGVAVDVDAYIMYQAATGEPPRARRMRAHWTLAKMTVIALKLGPLALWAMTGLFVRMIRRMGWRWVGLYLASLWRGVGGRGTATLKALAQGINSRDPAAVAQLFSAADKPIEMADGRLSTGELVAKLPADAQLEIEAPVNAGWTTTFRYRLGAVAGGIGILEFDAKTRKIEQARFFST